ncbi:MAG: 4Fe-4S dicluster domain-containing protein [Chloroflexota bacterium]
MPVWNEVDIDERVCTGCGICVENCPVDVLRLDTNLTLAYVAYLEDCQACFICVLDCPYDGAINVIVHVSDDVRQHLSRSQFY